MQSTGLQNQSAARVSDRAQKIATALVMIADLFPANDPFALELRQMAVTLIRETYVHDELSLGLRHQKVLSGLQVVEQVQMLVAVALKSHMISDMNAGIIESELRLMHQFLYGQYILLRDGTTYSRRDEVIAELFVDTGNEEMVKDIKDKQGEGAIKDREEIKDNSQISIKDNSAENTPAKPIRDIENMSDRMSPAMLLKDSPRVTATNNQNPAPNSIVRGMKNIEQVLSARGSEAPMAPDLGVGGNDRRQQILGILQEQSSESSLTDIAAHISGVSNKTVQRELSTLVARGLVEKTGERRWSRYQLSARGSAQMNRAEAADRQGK